MELEIPENNDEGVKEALKELNGKLSVALMKNVLQEVGDLLYLATNATAKDADQQIKVQNTLFTALKLCDAWNLMLTSFKIGASDINEKLYIAYLKLLDGFPDFALDDVKSVTTHVSSMKAACKKAEGTFTEAKQELTECIQSLKEDEEKMEHGAKETVESYRHAMSQLRGTYQSGFDKNKQWWNVNPAYQARLSEARKAYVDQSAKIPVCTIAKKALELALPKYHDAIGFLEKIESLVEVWYNECREVVEKQMKSNVKQAGKMSEAAQKEFWKPLPFTEEAFRYLCRWKALQLICQSTAVHLRRVRSAIDLYYTENPYPNEAIKKAWELKEKYDSLKSVEKFRDMAVPEAERNELVCCLSKLMMEIEDQHNLYNGVENQMKNLKEVTEHTAVLMSIIPPKAVASGEVVTQELDTFLKVLLNVPTKLSHYSFQVLLNVHFATLGILDGFPDAATAEIEEIQRDKDVSSDDLKNAIDQIQHNIFQLENQMSCLQKNLSEEVIPQMLIELDRTITNEVKAAASPGGKLEQILSAGREKVSTFFASLRKGKGNINERAAIEDIKFCRLSVEVLQLLMEKLPLLGNFKDHFSKINTEYLRKSSTTAKNELKVVKPEQRGQAWQDAIFVILNRLKDVHLGSEGQINTFLRIFELATCIKGHEKGRREQHQVDRSHTSKQVENREIWEQYKSTSMRNESIAERARQIDRNVNMEANTIRDKAVKNIERELEEKRKKAEQQRIEVENRKKREGEKQQERIIKGKKLNKREEEEQSSEFPMDNKGNLRPGRKTDGRKSEVDQEGGKGNKKTSPTAGEDQGGGPSGRLAAAEANSRTPCPYAGKSVDETTDPMENQKGDDAVGGRSSQTYHGAGVGELTDPKGSQKWNITANRSDGATVDSSSEDATEPKITSESVTGTETSQVSGAQGKGDEAKADLLGTKQGSGAISKETKARRARSDYSK